MAAVAGLGGAYLGSHATIVTQRDQARELRQAEARAKRAEVYAGFLDAAERYRFATEATSDATRESVSQAGSVKAACSAERERADRACGIRRSIFNRQQDARVDFQGALNQVYVYGSPRGIRAAGKIAESLPPSVYSGGDFEVGDVKPGEFSAGYNAVLDTMCREVSAEPRPTCL